MPRVPFVLPADRTAQEAGVAERPARLPQPRRRRLRLVQRALLRAGRLLRARRPLHRAAGRRERARAASTRAGSRASRSTASASTRRARRPRRSSGSGCRRSCAAARAAGVPDFQIFGEVFVDRRGRAVGVRARPGPAERARLPVPGRARPLRAPATRARGVVANRLDDDDYFAHAERASRRRPPTFLGNHDMGRAAQQIRAHAPGARRRRAAAARAARRTTCSTCSAARRSSTTATRSG